MKDSDRYWKMREVVEYTGFTSETIRVAIQAGLLIAYRANGCGWWRFKKADVDAWMQQHISNSTASSSRHGSQTFSTSDAEDSDAPLVD